MLTNNQSLLAHDGRIDALEQKYEAKKIKEGFDEKRRIKRQGGWGCTLNTDNQDDGAMEHCGAWV